MDDPILRNLLSESERHSKQVELLDHEVQAYIVRDIPKPPWFNRWRGVGCEGCGTDPAWEVLAHQVGCCNDSGLDDDGNFVWRGCHDCMSRWQRELFKVLGRLQRFLPVSCPGCGRPIARINDVILRQRRLV